MQKLILLFLLFTLATIDFARGGGGCFLAGTNIQTPEGNIKIEQIYSGQSVLGFYSKNFVVNTTVTDISEVERDYYYIIKTSNGYVKATAEHPFYIGDSQFKEVQHLTTGDIIYVINNNSLQPVEIFGITRINEHITAYNLEVERPHTFFANTFAVHNKGGGGCFLPGTKILSPEGDRHIENVNIGDTIYSFDERGNVRLSNVIGLYKVFRDYYYTISTKNNEVNATAEHPFYTSKGYVATKDLQAGEEVLIYSDGKTKKEKIISIKKIPARVNAYNLEVDNTHTFFANGFGVHNKGGGGGGGGRSGGRSSSRSGPPDNVFYYDCNNVYDNNGTTKACCKKINEKYVAQPLVAEKVKNINYPYCTCGSSCACVNDQKFASSSPPICPVSLIEIISNGLVSCFPLFVALIFIFLIVSSSIKPNLARMGKSEWSSTIEVNKSKIYAKSKKITALLSLWDQADPVWKEARLKKDTENTFLKLQDCWSRRDYSEMQPLLMPGIYNQHVAQLNAMQARHEINKIGDLKILDAQIVLVRNYHNTTSDEFTIWIKASARDTIVDDRTDKKIRGDIAAGIFEEFWTFQRQSNEWKLRSIDQPEEGMSIIDKENYDEISTQMGMERIYEKAGGPKIKDLNVGATREQDEESAAPAIGTIKWKGDRVHRLLNFLVESDKIWKEAEMLNMIRSLFIELNTAIEKRDLKNVNNMLTTEFYNAIEVNINTMLMNKQIVQKRNLAVRNVEIVLINNFYNRNKDNFTAWISGQAQQVIVDEKKGEMINGDTIVLDFEEFWTFQRKENTWLLSSIDKGLKAKDFVNKENFDEGTDIEMLQWYYTKDRVV